MPYGDYNGPLKKDKGKHSGSCNVTSCQASNAIWWNHGSYSWYCVGCKDQIYDPFGQKMWKKDFPHLKHPMFETKEMMEAREKK